MKNEEDAIKKLYPFVDESITPLPRCWSSTDKWHFLGVSQSNLRVTYRGQGKNHKDAAAVRTTHPIPPKCGIYYFEVKIISKGRDGYMGIGVCQKDVNLNRLPGWDRCSFGYHGDDGNFFCSSGSGVPYGPTFTTGDIIGCGVNLVENSCFYTKNGQNLGTAYTDLPNDLYPTVGLQTPGEVIETNFGQSPFEYNIQDEIREAQLRVQTSINRFPLPVTKTEWFNKLVSSYLVHHGFCASAESFNQLTGQQSKEDAFSMKNRQRLKGYLMNGRITECIQCVHQLYPGLLEKKQKLLFLLKCRQFIEMVAGADIAASTPSSSHSGSPSSSPPHKTSIGYSPYPRGRRSPASKGSSPRDSPRCIKSPKSSRTSPSPQTYLVRESRDHEAQNGCSSQVVNEEDMEMECAVENGSVVRAVVEADDDFDGSSYPGTSASFMSRRYTDDAGDSDSVQNGASDHINPMDYEDCSNCRDRGPLIIGKGAPVERLLQFGKDLLQLSGQVKGLSVKQKKMMQDAFSLLAYKDPYSSSVSYLLHPEQRESVSASLNSAILEELGYPARPALEVVMIHAKRLRDEMATNGIGSTAFADPDVLCELTKPSPVDNR